MTAFPGCADIISPGLHFGNCPEGNENGFLMNKYGIYSHCRNAVGDFGSFHNYNKEAIRWPKKTPQSHWIMLSLM